MAALALTNQSITVMKIRENGNWWLEETTFVFNREKATEIATMDECKEIIKRLLEIPWLKPNEITVEMDSGEEITADKYFRKVERWTLLRELPKIDFGGKCKNLECAKATLDLGDAIYVNGCEIWNDGRHYCWECYGSSANRRTLKDLRFIFSKIAKSEDYSFSVIPTNLPLQEIREVA